MRGSSASWEWRRPDVEHNNEQPLVRHIHARTICADGREEERSEALLAEHVLELAVNGEAFLRIVCTRTELREMVVGRLCTERLIDGIDDVAALLLTDADKRAEARLTGKRERRSLRPIKQAPPWESAWVFALARRFHDGLPLHNETFSAHCALLARRGEILCAAEDISRHNAVDKAVGYALLCGIPLSECMLFTSGRVPSDMVEKAVAAGIPVLVSKAAATAEAIRLAGEYGLTLLCRAREDSYCLAQPE